MSDRDSSLTEPFDDEEPPSLEELTLLQRLVVAFVQRPAVGFVLLILLLFAFAFLIALALTFPIVAVGLLVAVGLVIAAAAVLLFSRRGPADG
ncbi:hypothetical protein ACNS7O_08370 [Haloferacaceae archaeon DSL9]